MKQHPCSSINQNKMAKRTKKNAALRLEALEQRQLLAGVTGAGTEVLTDIKHANGNTYDQVLLTGGSVDVTADAGQVTRVSFLDKSGDIVQAEFSGKGTLTVSMADGYTLNADPVGYNQTGVKYVQGLASFTIRGSDSSTNLTVFSVGSGLQYVNPALFDSTHTGGDHFANVQKITIVADTANPNGSTFGGIRAGNAIFEGDANVTGIAAATVQVQDVVTVGDIKASGSATPTLTFGTASQFGAVTIAGGSLAEPNGKSISNSGSYNYGLNFSAGQKSDGSTIAAQAPSSGLTFTGTNPLQQQITTFTLTSGVDTIMGTTGNDQINATDANVTGLDSIDGNSGTDTFTVNDVTGTTAAGANLGLLTVKNVETLNVNSVSGLRGDAIDTTGWTGLTSEVLTLNTTTAQTITAAKTTAVSVVDAAAGAITVKGGGGGALIVQTGGAAAIATDNSVQNAFTSASFKKGSTVNFQDNSGGTSAVPAVGSTTTSVTLDGNTGAATLAGKGILTLNVSNSAGAIGLTNATGGALTVNAGGGTNGAITDASNKATSITVNATSDSTIGSLVSTNAGTLTLNANGGAITLSDTNLTKAGTAVVVTGSKNVTVTSTTALTATSFDASGASGKVTFNTPLPTGATYTGGSGVDVITVASGSTKATATGAGDDIVTLNGSTLASGGSIDGGSGMNTLTMTAANAAAVTTLGSSLSNFQKLVVTGATTNTIDMSKLLNIGNVDATGATAETFTNLPANPTINYTGNTTAINANIAVDSSVDVANVNITSDNTVVAAGTLTLTTGTVAPAQSVETVNITTSDTNSAPAGIQHSITLADTGLTSLKISGNAGVNATLTGDTSITSIDASGITKGALTVVTPALTNVATIKGSASGSDSITASAATKAVTVTTGTGGGTVIVNNANSNTVNAGAATTAISITTGSGADTITGGTKADTISSGTGLDTLTGGAGNDTFVVTTPLNGGAYASITDLAAGDMVQLPVVVANATGKIGAAVTQASTSSFANFLDAATAGAAPGTVTWFQYTDGNTYIVEDNSALSTFQNGTDVVLRVNGLVNLANSTVTTGANLLTIV